jgi:hypothetical protein
MDAGMPRMFYRAAVLTACVALAAWPAGKKAIAEARGENEDLIVTATLYYSPAEVKELLGNDLGGHFVVADVKIEPKYGKEASVYRDDFVLRDIETVEKSTPYAPSQIAGRATLVVRRTGDREDGTAKKGEKRSSVSLGGIMGTGSPGTVVGDANLGAKMQNADEPKDAALEKLLNERQLPEKKSDKPVAGLLYFAFEKIKLKDMELDYGPKPNRIVMKFKETK